MKPFYLLDTNIVSELNKVRPDQRAVNKIVENLQFSAISCFTWSELLYGQKKLPETSDGEKKKKERLFHFIYDVVQPTFSVLGFDDFAASIFADLRIATETKETIRPFIDLQIASLAISQNMILVTRNCSDFEGIPGLNLENWFE